MADNDKKFLDEDGVSQFAEETKNYVDNKVSQLDDKYIRSDDTTIIRLRNQNEINLQEDHNNAWFGYRDGKVTNWKFGDGTEGGLADVYANDYYLGDEKLSETYIRVDDTTIVKLVNDNEINLQEDHNNAWFGYRGGKVTNWKFGDGTEGGLADVYVKDLYLGDQKLSDLLGAKANDDDVVHKSGNETITGNKTFSNSPTVTRQGVGTVGYNVKLAFKRGEEISATNHSTFRIIDADNDIVSEVCTENYADGKVAQILNIRNTNDAGAQVQSSVSHLLDKTGDQDWFYSTRDGKTYLGTSSYRWADVNTKLLNGKTPAYASDLENYLPKTTTLESLSTNSIPFHNAYPRCKYLGTSITDAQNEAIRNRTYDDLFIGDYWTINGVNWRIVAIDYYYNVGNVNFDKGNIIVMPDTVLYNAQMNETNTTAGAYAGSLMRTQNLNSARTIAQNAFGSHLANHRILLANAVDDLGPGNWAWYDSDGVELPNEVQIFGTRVWGSALKGFDVGTQKQQFPLFEFAPQFVNTRQTYWLQDVSSRSVSGDFAIVSDYGYAGGNLASHSNGVRPSLTLSYI